MSNRLQTNGRTYALQGLAQIERTAKNGIWDAHWGCAVIAGALLLEENAVQSEAKSGIVELLESLSTAEKGFDDDANLPKQSVERSQFTKRLLEELAIGAVEVKEIGHAVIYCAYVLKALDHFAISPWESLLSALINLIRDLNASGPGWITINGVNELREFSEVETKTAADYWTIFTRFDRPLSMEAGDMQLGHLLTHGHAIHMLEAHADKNLIGAFDYAYRRRLHGLTIANGIQRDRTLPSRRKIDPRSKGYWNTARTLGDMHGHILKYAYSFVALRGDSTSTGDLEAYGRIVWPDKIFPEAH